MSINMPRSAGALVAVCFSVIGLLPVKFASELMAWIFSRVSWSFLKKGKIKRNLQGAFPDLDEPSVDAIIARMAPNFGRHIAEVVHMSTFRNDTGDCSVTYAGSPNNPFEGQGPAIYIGAHLGSWELVPIVFQRHSRPLTIIYSLIENPLIDRLLLSLRQRTGAIYVEKPEALKASIKALQRGESIALLVDQRVEAGIEVEFFGRPSVFTPLPARLAIRFKCPIIPCEAVRLRPGNIEVTFHPPIWPRAESGKQAEIEMTQTMARAIEGSISRHPDTWLCNKRRWPNQPTTTPPTTTPSTTTPSTTTPSSHDRPGETAVS